jgi:arylsulfatase A-like enzyme
MPATRPNIVLIVLDTARATAFEPWGAAPGTTPTVADLATHGTAVAQAIAPCNWTMPSHASLFTGCLPRTVGLADRPGPHPHTCRPVLEANRGRILPAVLARAGYDTAAVSANPWIARPNGFGTGFDDFEDARGSRDHRIDDGSVKARLRWWYEALVAKVDDGAASAAATVDAWLEQPRRAPFFWFVNLLECHSPYLPPKPWNDLPAHQRVLAAEDARRHLTLEGIWSASAGGFDIGDGALARMRHLYQRSVSSMDAWVGRLVHRLEQKGLLDDTYVIVTSDHGENLGEGNLIGHAFSLAHRLIHVPLVVHGPDRVALPDLLSLAALPVVIGDLAGLAANPWTRDDRLPAGVAVSQYDGVLRPGDPAAGELVAKWGLGPDAVRIITAPTTSVTDGAHKLVRQGDRLRLYDLTADPDEVAPTVVVDPGAHSPTAARLFAAMVEADATDADPEVVAQIVRSAEADVDDGGPELEQQLRLLGYL